MGSEADGKAAKGGARHGHDRLGRLSDVHRRRVGRRRDKGLLEIVDPATEEVVARVANGGTADAEAAVRAARRAFDEGPWPHTPARRARRAAARRRRARARARRRAGPLREPARWASSSPTALVDMRRRRRPARLRRRARRAHSAETADHRRAHGCRARAGRRHGRHHARGTSRCCWPPGSSPRRWPPATW